MKPIGVLLMVGILALLALCAPGSGAQVDCRPPSGPAASLLPRPSPIIGAFYYPWYGNPTHDGGWNHWEQNGHLPPADIGSDYYPLLGAYSVRDPAVLAQQMGWLKQAKVDVIISSWWGQGSWEDQSLPGLLAAAAAEGIGVAFHIEPYGERSAEQLVADVQYLYANYGDSPGFYRTTATSRHNPRSDPKGLFFVWSIGYQSGDGPPVEAAYWRPAVDQIHALPESGLVFADMPDGSWVDAGHFDGEYNYAFIHDYEAAFLGWSASIPPEAWYVPSLVPGFTAERVGYPPETFSARDGGDTYDAQWRAALETGVTPQMITITSFNEWHEGTQIEPAAEGMDDGLGYTYPGYALGPTQYLTATAAWVDALPALMVGPCDEAITVTLGTLNASQGLYQRDLADGLTEPVSVGGREARMAIENPHTPARYVYLWLNNTFHYSATTSVRVGIDYYDIEEGGIRVQYDSADPGAPLDGAYKDTAWIPFTGSFSWHMAELTLPDAYFAGRQNGGADLRIDGSNSYVIGRVVISRTEPSCRDLYLPLVGR